MAITPRDTDEAFLREVDEGVRRDRLLSLWRRYGVIGITVLVVGLAALGGWLWWQHRQQLAAGEAGEQLVQAMNQLEVGEGARARPVLDRLAKDGPGAYPGLARMVLANDLVAGGQTARAAALFDAVAADASLPQPLRDAALVKAVRLTFDTLPPAQVAARLQPLAVPGNPWFGVAGEMLALARIKAGQPDQAVPVLTAIVKDEGQPASLRGRTAQLALSLGVDPQALGLTAQPPVAAPQPAPAGADRG